MVLASGKYVQTNLFGLECDLRHRLDAFPFGGGAPGGQILGDVTDCKNAELHSVPFVASAF